jgi:predicted HD phosphohydrolase
VKLAIKRLKSIQGGGFTDEQILDAQKDPWLEAKLAVRRWDDLAKDPDCVVPNLEAYRETAYQFLLGE